MKALNILGTRGIPGRHGGYETFATRLAPHLVERGWKVLVYCQSDEGPSRVDEWRGIQRVHFSARLGGAAGTMEFDAKCVRDVLSRPGVDLVLGYNTALFNVVQTLAGRTTVMNMDGIEWKRDKWGRAAKAWFFMNELVGASANTILVADHPEIEKHTRKRSRRPIEMIPYGADSVTSAGATPLEEFGLVPDEYFIVIARPTPENSILEIIRAFSARPRGRKLAVLGSFDPSDAYQLSCVEAAGPEVAFLGPIFDDAILSPLRFHARAYIHGHTVGGTNPSLCEALGAGNAVLAHDNRFNRWTAGDGQFFFDDEAACDKAIDAISNDDARVNSARAAARAQHARRFTWSAVLSQYEQLFERLI